MLLSSSAELCGPTLVSPAPCTEKEQINMVTLNAVYCSHQDINIGKRAKSRNGVTYTRKKLNFSDKETEFIQNK